MSDIEVVLLQPPTIEIEFPTNWAGGGGSGTVDSVNGQTGVVELDATDIPYDPEYADTISFGYWTPTTDYENTQAFVDRFVEGFVGLGTQVAGFADAINSLMTDGPACISRRINKVAHGVTSKQVVRLTGGSESGAGYYVGSDCTSLENSQVDGMVWAVQDDDNFTLMLAGYRDEFSGYTPPKIYYLSETPGVLSDTPPTTPGHVVKAVAKAVGSTRLLFFPNSPCYVIGEDGITWGDITGDIADQTDLQTALASKVDENAAITGATKTKITYDAKGLVTSGADATTADIADSTNRRYVTDANLTVIGNTSGVNTGDQNLSGLVPTSRTVNGLALSADVRIFSALRPTSGDYYSLGGQSTASTPGFTNAGKLAAHPLWLDVGTLDRIAVSSSVAAVSTWRLGLYKASPLTDMCDGEVPFLDAGTVDMNNTAGLQAITISKDILVPGWYWAAILVDSYTAQPTTHNVTYSSNSGLGVPGLPQDMSSFGRYRVGRVHGSTVPTGLLPTFPTTSMTWLGIMPRISVRYA